MTKDKKILVVSFQSLTANSGGGMARLGYYLSAELHKRHLLKEFIVYSKGKYTTEFPSSPVSFWSRYFLFVLNRLDKYLHFAPYKFRYWQEVIFDWFCAKKITRDVDQLFVTQPYLKRTFKKAKKLGIPIFFIPANPEENYIKKLVLEERKELEIDHEEDAYTYDKRLRYFNQSIQYVDKVIGTYPTVYETYKHSSFGGEVVKMIGHLKPDFKPVKIEHKEPAKKTFMVGYLAHTVVLKGLQYLMAAWDMINAEHPDLDIRLCITGKIDDSMHEYIVKHHLHTKKMQLLGRLPDVQSFLNGLHLFVVPSLTEGGPYTALEAAHYAVPVVITENCGSAELLSRNNPGCKIVPIKDAESIKNEILWAYNHKEAAAEMGMNAKKNLDTYSMEELIKDIANYLERQLEQTQRRLPNPTDNKHITRSAIL